MRDSLHQSKFGWITSIVLVMKQVLQSVVMADGVHITAGTVRMWEWSADIHQKRRKVGHLNIVLKTTSMMAQKAHSSVVIFETVLL